MKASELMIGDWVSCDGKCYLIAEIGGMVCIDAENELFASLEDISPILLTPEILEKNGFGYIEKSERITHFYLGKPYFCANMDIHIGTADTGDFWLNYFGNSIYCLRYVHELQHALRLCRIEKEIIL